MKIYELSNLAQLTIERAFVMHPTRPDQEDRVRHIHDRVESMTRQLATLMPDSKEQQEMIRCLREAMFWGQEAILKNEIGGKL